MLLRMNADQQNKKQTSIEVIGYGILDGLGVNYSKQFMIASKFCVDAFAHDCGVIVQFDGDYWHGNPAKFASLDKRQAKRVALDNSQDRYMDRMGYKVARFWESTLKKEPDTVKDLLHKLLVLQEHTLFPPGSNRFVA